MAYEHKVTQVFDGQEDYLYPKDTIKISAASVRACFLLGIWLAEFSCNTFSPCPVKHTERGSSGKASLEAL